jgi:hypothetical protein
MSADAPKNETPPGEPAPGEAAPTEDKPKKAGGGFINPLTLFTKLSLRVQVLLLAGAVLIVILLFMPTGKKKPQESTRPTASAPALAGQTDAEAPPPSRQTGAEERQPATDPLRQRTGDVTPDRAELIELGKATPRAIDTVQDRKVGSADGITVSLASPKTENGEAADEDEYGGESGGGATSAAGGRRNDGPRPAGAPYTPKGKRTAVEVMGIVAPPAPGEGERAPATARGAPVSDVTTPVSSSGAPDRVPGAVAGQPAKASAPSQFAPFGRLVKCKLVNTLDSLVPQNVPVIALVTEDVVWNGKVIVPAGTEVFAYVKSEPKMDAAGIGRLFDNGEWRLVLPRQPGRVNGLEWKVRGRALDRRELVVEPDGRVRSWGLDDLAPGLIGHTISTLNYEEVKLFTAAFFSEAASALGETLQEREGVAGSQNGATQPKATPVNALYGGMGAGISGVMSNAAERILEEIQKRGYYVRVPSGKEFYLFVEETLHPSEARVGRPGGVEEKNGITSP